ncbi:hypothetical protein Z950_1725 [Sulfitobacter mediterraneus KCTC 32188]|nr:hypothetical protein Z950_1725 [Sulfitobacter mediterraneus KCTC 32188]
MQIALRVPQDLRDEIKAEAGVMGRSMNTHILITLREAVRNESAEA